jgi:uncharacterized protein YyaL (SSP411 family)
MSSFHFSPRPNRASEIAWREWSDEAFAQARAEDKPVLLAISAVWCHWCHVMDETSYSQDEIIDFVNRNYVPVRVDNDRRPDVNARYNQGGWPTTAFLTPGGSLLAGATYLPPNQMATALQQISEFYRTNRSQIEERALQLRSAAREVGAGEETALAETMIDAVREAIAAQFDDEYAGFGSEPKFPMTDVLEFLLQEYRISNDRRCYDMLARSMLAMSSGGMYDRVEGGFFRYSTTRDWSVPHYEKMTEDHAALLRILCGLVRSTNNAAFRTTLRSACGYVRSVLFDAQAHRFAGSQDADEAYYELPLEERRGSAPPYVDRTSYSNWTAAMAASFVASGTVLEDDALIAIGTGVLDTLHEEMRDGDGLLFHYVEPGGTPQVRGLLGDQSAYLRALLDAHEETGEERFLERARELAGAIDAAFTAPGGGFYDHAALERALGNLVIRDRPLPDNASLADSFARLAALLEDPQYRERAQAALRVYAQSHRHAGLFAAPFARALRQLLHEPRTLVIVGSARETEELREASRHLPDPLLSIRTTTTSNGRERGAAYLCAGTHCAAPARTAQELRAAYEQLAGALR